jgi:hypothetical protein
MKHRGRVVTAAGTGIAIVVALLVPASPAGAKGEELHAPTPLLRRETDASVTIRAARGPVPDEWYPGACDDPGCLPRPCQARGIAWLGLSTSAAVGEGQFEIYRASREPATFAASGTFGTIVDRPVGWIAVRTGPRTSSVTADFRYGGTDSMRPVDGWAVLAAPLRDVPAVQVLPPTATITARDAEGARLDTVTVDADTPWPAPPGRCASRLAQRFPKVTGSAPADEDAARAEVAAAYSAAYAGVDGNGLDWVEDGPALAEVARIAGERFPQYVGTVHVAVDEIRFIDRDAAALRFSLEVLGADGAMSGIGVQGVGRAVLRSGRWVVSRGTFCSVLAYGGVYCPLRTRAPLQAGPARSRS